MSNTSYRRMDINVSKLIEEVHSRSLLWDKASPDYSDRLCREDAWTEICDAVFENEWRDFTSADQRRAKEDVKTRWKSVRDRFLKFERDDQKSGSSPSKKKRMPNYEALLFLLPSRGQRPSSGNFEERSVSPADQVEQQQVESEPPSGHHVQEAGGESDSTAASWVASPSPVEQPSTSAAVVAELEGYRSRIQAATTAAASTPVVAAPPASTRPRRQEPPSQTSSSRERPRRTPRRMDRMAEVETEALSLIQRVEGDDKFDFFGYGIATSCRQLRPARQEIFMGFVHSVMAVLDGAPRIPPLGDMISRFWNSTWLSDEPQQPQTMVVETHQPQSVSTATQTDPVFVSTHPPPPQPTAGTQFYSSFYPYAPPYPYTSSGPNLAPEPPHQSEEYPPHHYTNL